MHKIYVRRSPGRWIVWASFRLAIDRDVYADQLAAQNPSWCITTADPVVAARMRKDFVAGVEAD